MKTQLEHINITVEDPKAKAEKLSKLFGWEIRWEGSALGNGFTVHVGTDTQYLAIYSGTPGEKQKPTNSYATLGGLNHIGIVVDDLDKAEAEVKAAGYEPHSHADYEPGKRFYFHDEDGIEFELVSYA